MTRRTAFVIFGCVIGVIVLAFIIGIPGPQRELSRRIDDYVQAQSDICKTADSLAAYKGCMDALDKLPSKLGR